jgi:hypothetical protein
MKQEFLVGFFGNGGQGVHPIVTTEEYLLEVGFVKGGWTDYTLGDDLFITVNSKVNEMPEGLLICSGNPEGWMTKTITNKEALQLFGDNKEFTFGVWEMPTIALMFSVDIKIMEKNDGHISYIPEPVLHMVNWSDSPELQADWSVPIIQKTLHAIIEETYPMLDTVKKINSLFGNEEILFLYIDSDGESIIEGIEIIFNAKVIPNNKEISSIVNIVENFSSEKIKEMEFSSTSDNERETDLVYKWIFKFIYN